MANKTFFDVQSSNREVKIIATKVVITGATAADPNAKAVLTDSAGNDIATNGIESVAYGTTGGGIGDDTFKITLADKYEALLSVHVTKGNDNSGSGGNPTSVQDIDEDVSGARTVEVDMNAALDVGDEFYVTLFLLNTSVTK